MGWRDQSGGQRGHLVGGGLLGGGLWGHLGAFWDPTFLLNSVKTQLRQIGGMLKVISEGGGITLGSRGAT